MLHQFQEPLALGSLQAILAANHRQDRGLNILRLSIQQVDNVHRSVRSSANDIILMTVRTSATPNFGPKPRRGGNILASGASHWFAMRPKRAARRLRRQQRRSERLLE